jgi:hypothetical protein
MMTWSKGPSRVLLFTAIFELLLAGVFVVLAVTIPPARTGMVITAGVLGITGLGLFAWAKKASKTYAEAERLRQTGLDGSAAIAGMCKSRCSYRPSTPSRQR